MTPAPRAVAATGSPLRFAGGSILVGIVVLAMKALAAWQTGSAALYSDAVESVVNVAAAGVAFVALGTAIRPADTSHPYGHGKAEYLSAVFEGVMIVGAALLILHEATTAALRGVTIANAGFGLAINAAAGTINAIWCAVLFRIARRHRSPALRADARHLLADVVSSGGVLAGFALVAVTGVTLLDPLMAGLVAVNVLWSGWRLVRESVGGLMDQAVAPEEQERIAAAIAAAGEGSLQAHDLRTRRAGARTFVDFHLVVPGAMTVAEAHGICDRIERRIEAELGDTQVTIHVEPHGKAKAGPAVVATP